MIKNIVLEIFGGTWPMIVIFTVILSSVRIAYLIIKKEKLVLYKELTWLLFLIYLLSLFYIVTFQDDNYGTSNFIPFREMFRYNISSKLFLKNIIGNVLLYIPFGLFVSAYLDNKKIIPTLILTFIASISIESTQLIIGRVFDVDDIILNLFGGLIGGILFIIFDNIKDKLPKALKKERFINIVFIVLLIIAILYFTNISAYLSNMVN